MSSKLAVTNILFLFARMVFSMGLSLYCSRIILEALGISDYGTYNVVGGMVAMIAFLHYSLNGATMRFMNLAITSGELSKMKLVFNTAFAIHIIIAVFIVVIGETVGLWFFYNKLNIPPDRLYAASWVYHFSIASMVLNVIQIPYDSAIIAHQRMKVFAYVTFLESLLKLGVAYVVLYSYFDKLIVYGFLLLCVSLIIRLIYQIYCRINFEECRFSLSFDKKMFKEISIFFGWDIFGNISSLARVQGINVLQNIFFGTFINAAMGLATVLGGVITSIASAVNLALKPQIFESYFKENYPRVEKLVEYGTRGSFFLLSIICIPLLLETQFFLSLWLKEVPEFTVEFSRLIVISTMVGILFDFLPVVVNATGKIKYLSVLGGIIYSGSVVLSYILLKSNFGIFTTSIISIGVSMLMGIGILYIVKNLMPQFNVLEFFKTSLVKPIAVFAISFFTCYLLKSYANFSNSFLLVASFIVVIPIVIFIFGVTRNEKVELKKIVQSYIK